MTITRQQRRATERRQKQGKPEPDRTRYMPRAKVDFDIETTTPEAVESRRNAQQAVAMALALAHGGLRG